MRTWFGPRLGLMMGAGLCLACQLVSPGADGLTLPLPDGMTPPGGLPPPQVGSGDGVPVKLPDMPLPNGPLPEGDLPVGLPPGFPGAGGGGRATWLRASFYAGVSPEGLAVGDFTGDGVPDVAINAGGRNHSSPSVARVGEFFLLRGDGKGHLVPEGDVRPTSSTGRIVGGDVDGDGQLEVLVGTREGTRLIATRWNSTTTEMARFLWNTSSGPVSSLGLWPTAAGPARIWSLGNSAGPESTSPPASFRMIHPPTASTAWVAADLYIVGKGRDRLQLVSPQDTDRAAAIADFNEDGVPDVVMNNPEGPGWRAHVLLGLFPGVVSPLEVLPTQAPSWSRVYTADFNHDGHVDLLGLGASSLEVFLGTGQGTFLAAPVLSLTALAEEAAVVDFDGDGREDVVALHGSTSEVSLFRGMGDGQFAPQGRLAVGRRPSAAAAMDLDHDGTPELLIAEADDNAVSAYRVPPVIEVDSAPAAGACALGLASGTVPLDVEVAPLARLTVGPTSMSSVTVGDFNGDGRSDLAFTREYAVQVVLGQKDGELKLGSIEDTAGATSLVAADLDGNGRAELALTQSSTQVRILSSVDGRFFGDDSFQRLQVRGSRAFGVLAGDFNGDGLVDLAASAVGGCVGSVARFLNQGPSLGFTLEPASDFNSDPVAPCPIPGTALAGDYDGDGTLDLVHPTMGLNLNRLGRGGTLPLGHGFELDPNWDELWSVDADGDGRLDVVARFFQGRALFFRGDGHGTLQAPFTCTMPLDRRLLAWEDVTGDGRADLVGETEDHQGFWIAPGEGPGQWGTPRRYKLSGEVEWVRAVDLMGDARRELVVLVRSGALLVFPAP